VGTDVEETTLELLKTMVDEEAELISIYYGEDVTQEEAEALEEKVEELFGDCDVEMYAGNQPIYYYLVSVE
jgi:dihydroxyacetone kinase-like predicted kinase